MDAAASVTAGVEFTGQLETSATTYGRGIARCHWMDQTNIEA